MNNVNERFNELNIQDTITCTEDELQDFLYSGLLFKSGKSYITRNRKALKVKLIKNLNYDLEIDLSELVKICEDLCTKYKNKKVYCMTKNSFNKYKEMNYIINKNNVDYYKDDNNDLWLIYII